MSSQGTENADKDDPISIDPVIIIKTGRLRIVTEHKIIEIDLKDGSVYELVKAHLTVKKDKKRIDS